MKPNMIARLLAASIGAFLFAAVGIAQNSTKQADTGSSSATSGPATTQVSGVITSVNRHEGTSLFEIKVKDSAGKKHEISVSPSAVIKQGDQKAAGSALQKGSNVEAEIYTTPSGSVTAKTITITTATSKP